MQQAQERKEKEAAARTEVEVATHSIAGPSGTQPSTSKATETITGDVDDIIVQNLLTTEEGKENLLNVRFF